MPSPPPLAEIEAKALRESSAAQALELVRNLLGKDSRAGARRLVAKFERKLEQEKKETQRQEKMRVHEQEARSKGFRAIAGVDEAGRGPLAGPVVAAAVVLSEASLPGVDDSKKLTPEKREELFPIIHQRAVSVGVGQASVPEIDALNIYHAARLAMERAVENLGTKPDFLLTDAMPLPKLKTIAQKPIIHGDALSVSIAAASVVAKVTRDRIMAELHQKYPAYGFGGHKGYGTAEHLKALEDHGACPEHRLSFGPVMETLAKKTAGGPFQFWSGKLNGAKDLPELQQVGVQIKRVALSHLTEGELGALRELFKGKRAKWENQKP